MVSTVLATPMAHSTAQSPCYQACSPLISLPPYDDGRVADEELA